VSDGEIRAWPSPGREEAPQGGPRRTVRAMAFGDFQGFSKLTDEQLPRFTERVLGAIAEVLARHRDDVCDRNTWGDALYVVLKNAGAAAEFALDLQATIAAIDLGRAGLPESLAMRLGCHLGPVFATHDPVLSHPVYMGSHVSRTARIEPVTPAGAVYVTEPFAAALVLNDRREFACDYVGHMDAAKGYGRLRMYRLRHSQAVDALHVPATEATTSPI
jgi:class 3 adenylate cyclase